MKFIPLFKPFVAAQKKVPEFTVRAVVLGMLLGLLFGIGNAYLALKIGTTVSASIPAAVLSMGILRTFFKNVSILENNLVQTIASVGEGLAAGMTFTVPALFLLGDHPSLGRLCLLSLLGGVLGILFMIPMRRYIIVQEHGKLPFPEGTACAEILKSSEDSKSKALMAILGVVVGALYKVCSGALSLWQEVVSWVITPFQKTTFSMDCTPALLGVGFIIGPRIASLLFAGGVVGWWIFIPLIRFFGEQTVSPLYPATISIAQMSPEDIWSYYIRYIGAGAVACGGILSLFKIAPLIQKTLKIGFAELFQKASARSQRTRVDRDISLRWLILGSVAIILTLWLAPGLSLNFLTILVLVILGFFFVAVTSLTVGIVGSTSNPVSGMMITTLLITCLIFLSLGWTERVYLIAALTMGIVACVAICLAGTTSQDLKTGYLLGATPRTQQIGEIIGVILPALAIGGVIYLLSKAYSFGSDQMPTPQATMLALISQGVMQGDIPFTLLSVGVLLGLLMEMLRIPILPFAIGLYLPLSLSTATMVGGVISAYVKKTARLQAHQRGVLIASGLVAGDACTGVVIALLTVMGSLSANVIPLVPSFVSLFVYLLLGLGLAFFAKRK